MFSSQLMDEIENIFKFWQESGVEFQMPQYTAENCLRAKSIIINLVSELEKIGMSASEQSKLEAFESSVRAMNNLNSQIPGLIETGEREELCDLYDEIAKSVNLNPREYGAGDGIATEWRHW